MIKIATARRDERKEMNRNAKLHDMNAKTVYVIPFGINWGEWGRSFCFAKVGRVFNVHHHFDTEFICWLLLLLLLFFVLRWLSSFVNAEWCIKCAITHSTIANGSDRFFSFITNIHVHRKHTTYVRHRRKCARNEKKKKIASNWTKCTSNRWIIRNCL